MTTLISNGMRSKHPSAAATQRELQLNQEGRVKLDHEIRKLEKLCKAKETEPFQLLILDSYQRLREIERKRMSIPVENIQAHAEIVGQWKERFRLTGELLYDKSIIENKRRMIDTLAEKGRKIAEQLAKNFRRNS